MGKQKIRPYQKKSFESTGISSDTSANVYSSMQKSLAWQHLTAQQKVLYLACKDQYYAEKKKPYLNPEYFTMNQSKWADMYCLYKRNNAAAFYRDMEQLITHGFIRCVECGSTTRTKSIYSFSDLWQQYDTAAAAREERGEDPLPVPLTDMTAAMLRKRRKEKSI